MKLTIYGNPVTKKNSQRIVKAGDRLLIIQSPQYTRYERDALLQIRRPRDPITGPVNVACVYYMQTRRRVDLVNLLEATLDVLVKAGVLADDNARIVAGHDGSRVDYDKARPRVEIEITEVEVVP